MTSYPNGQHHFGNGLINQAGKKSNISSDLPPFISDFVPFLQPTNSGRTRLPNARSHGIPKWQQAGIHWGKSFFQWAEKFARRLLSWRPKDVLGAPLVLIVIWIIVLWWGEEATFRRNVRSCNWDHWESWPSTATPHHVVLIADPQLVDPHTYPGRPWPLSSLTIQYTDLYIRKSFQQIQQSLAPDSVFFLGDLFDGGREWSTDSGSFAERESPDKRWRKYGTKFWLKEYARFNRIFFDPWLQGRGRGGQAQPGRKLIAGLPGNHDLGLGSGIRIPVRDRFQAYFGSGNRFDIVGNHSFVSLDTVSLSAKGQSGNTEEFEESHMRGVWSPVDHFLHTAKAEKARAIDRELRVRNGRSENERLEHDVLELDDIRASTIPIQSQKRTDIPSVVLTHVPLYRDRGTPCGPLRERYPPSKSADGKPLEKDDPNSIALREGLQYQNVLLPAISNEIVESIGDVTHVFSGDDHDHCDVIHRRYTSRNSGIREITVKSISWAMGVRHPGFLLLSLWNPVDPEGKSIGQAAGTSSTIQAHLCLLPDQLSIFIRYGWLLMITLLMLFGEALRNSYRTQSRIKSTTTHVLPLTRVDSVKTSSGDNTSATARSPSVMNRRLSVRSSAGKSRGISPSNGYGYDFLADKSAPIRLELTVEASTNASSRDLKWNDIDLDELPQKRTVGKVRAVYDEFRSGIAQVASFVLLWYAWLLWNS